MIKNADERPQGDEAMTFDGWGFVPLSRRTSPARQTKPDSGEGTET